MELSGYQGLEWQTDGLLMTFLWHSLLSGYERPGAVFYLLQSASEVGYPTLA